MYSLKYMKVKMKDKKLDKKMTKIFSKTDENNKITCPKSSINSWKNKHRKRKTTANMYIIGENQDK